MRRILTFGKPMNAAIIGSLFCCKIHKAAVLVGVIVAFKSASTTCIYIYIYIYIIIYI